jgi:hypothetical protein
MSESFETTMATFLDTATPIPTLFTTTASFPMLIQTTSLSTIPRLATAYSRPSVAPPVPSMGPDEDTHNPDAERIARHVALGFFFLLLTTALIAVIHWSVMRVLRHRASKKAKDDEELPYTEKPQIASFPNVAIEPTRDSRESWDSRSITLSPRSSPKSRTYSPEVSPKSQAPRRKYTAGSSTAPNRPSTRPPPLEWEGMPRSSSSSIHSGRSVFYMHTCPSSSTVGREEGDLHHYPMTAPASPLFTQHFSSEPQQMGLSAAHIRDQTRPNPHAW